MPFFGPKFLEELKERVPVLTLAQKHFQLRKAGGGEWQVVGDTSFTISERKNLWYDFGKYASGGDVFELEQFVSHCTFEQAVEAVAAIAGIPLPGARNKPRSNGAAAPSAPRDDIPPAEDPSAFGAGPAPSSAPVAQRVAATYDFIDREGLLSYQVARREWTADGKHRKNTMPRRPVPDDPDHWVWGLQGGPHLRGRSGDWYHAEGRNWPGAERRMFDEVAPILYRLPELMDEVSEPEEDQRPIFIPEGEKDVDTLVEWGLVATTNHGGTNGWRSDFPDYFAGADVIIPFDNDAPGRAFAHLKAASLRLIARRVRLLDPKLLWPQCPEKGDVTDWRDIGGGTVDRLWEVLDKVPDWTRQPPETTFSAKRYVDIDRGTRPLTWTIKGVMQRGTISLWYGAPSCGKSFLLTDASMAIARGQPWMGKRSRSGLVIYQTGEGHDGFGLRLKAYRDAHRLPLEDDVPFVFMPVRINLYKDDADVVRLIAEIKAWQTFYDYTLELVVIDTFNAASLGANENSNQDVGRVIANCRRIAEETGAHVAVVHHTPATGGRPRGHSSLVGDVETTVAVEETEHVDVERTETGTGLHRTIRSWSITKQKDAPDRFGGSFVLKAVKVGTDQDGDDVTSCIVSPLATAAMQAAVREVPQGYAVMSGPNEDIIRALVKAIKKHGRAPVPPSDGKGDTPPPGCSAVTIKEWQDELIETYTGHEELTVTLRNRIKARIYRACKHWGPDKTNLVGKAGDWAWRTDRKIFKIDAPPVPRYDPPNPEPTLAPGETQADFGDLMGR